MLAVALRGMGVRAALAVIAVGLGVAAATLRLAVTAGAERELAAVAEQAGRNLLILSAGQELALPGRGRGWVASDRLDRDDAEALAAQVPSLTAVVPMLEGSRRAVLGRESLTTTVRGVPPEYLTLRRFEVARGRAFDAADEADRGRFAVVGAFVARRLAGDESLVGRTVRIGGVPFEVVGELAEKGLSPDGQNEDDQVLIPLETARRRLFNRESLSRLVLQAESAERIEAVDRQVRGLLRQRHRLAPNARDDFDLVPLLRSSLIRHRGAAFLSAMAGIFAATTLAVGGAGVLAVSLLNVKDRTPEIGLRRAVGARRRDVAALFVAEACVLGIGGGAAGLAVGVVAVAVLGPALGWPLAIDGRGILGPLLASLAIGLVSGVVPALRAARVPPIAALRDG